MWARKRAALALAGLSLAGTASLTACDPGPPCEQWTYIMQWHTHTIGKTTYTTFDQTPVCVKWGPEPTKSAK
jgi:hypothetical protein